MLFRYSIVVVIFISLEQLVGIKLYIYYSSKYLFMLLLAANVLLPRELDYCNYYVKEASKPTLRAAN
ncbi:hypothetical protein HBI04_009580 [Parastagonospora nodorum]|nr:hypothetical protein HBI03_010410 [Parastagonospora nodorum]KAH4284306.1 hypothetical protein HBI04_009580 [Parastagonospora nodorum]KAH5532566.1 hypothetical protein HBI52_006470 [Parastagonospora nodorum]